MRERNRHDCTTRATRNTTAFIAALVLLTATFPAPGAGPATRPSGAAPQRDRKIVLIAGKKSHGIGAHEYEKGCRLIKACLDSSPNVKGVQTVVVTNGWPTDEKVLDDADSIFLFCDGADNGEDRHPLLKDDRLQTLGKLMDRGVGFAILHYTIFVPTNHGGKEFQNWVGGYFDYDSLGPSTLKTRDKWYSTLGEAETTTTPMSAEHPILRGVKPFTTKTENYWKIHFLLDDPRLTPLLTFDPAKSAPPARESVVAWAVERKDGGRGFAYTEGHYHSHWQIESFRKVMLNALLWTAHAEVPEGGVESTPPEEFLK
jgi:type 1 glutamine amidotransferase